MMRYWNLLWDWNTLDSVRAVHSFLEGWALIFFGLLVLFEILAHFAEENKPRSTTLERIGLVCFAVAVFAEGLGYLYGQRNDSLSEKIIISLSELAGTADTKARQALGVSSAAMTQSSKAVDASGKATTSASNALGMAREARQEADSFEKDIRLAKQGAENAEKGTARISDRLSDRTLTDQQVTTITGKLKDFSGQEFDVTTYWESKEPLAIANRIADALVAGSWKYDPPKNASFLLGGISGVQVWRHPDADQQTKNAADSLTAGLVKEGIAAELRIQNPTNNPKHNKISLTVGAKP